MTALQRRLKDWWYRKRRNVSYWKLSDRKKMQILGNSPAEVEHYLVPIMFQGHKVKVHAAIWQRLNNALWEIRQHEKKTGKTYKVKTIESYNWRMVRGSKTTRSNHSWAIAVDINARDNGMGARTHTIPSYYVKAFSRWGFRWGGTFSRRDWMHFEG